MRDLSIRLKMTLLILALFVAGSASVVVVLNQMYASTVDVLAAESLHESRNTFDRLENASVDKLVAALDVILTRDDLRVHFEARDQAALLEAASPLFDELRTDVSITHWYFEEPAPDSTVFLRVHNPEKSGDPLTDRWVYGEAVSSGEIGYGKELGQTAFALRVVKPFRGETGEVIGYVELGQEIDSFLAQMRADTGTDFAMIVRKEHLDREAWASVMEVAGLPDRWDADPDYLMVDSTIDADLLTEYDGALATVPEIGEVLGVVREGGRTFVRGIFPVFDASGAQVGGVLVLSDVTDVTAAMNQVRFTLLVVGAVLGFATVATMIGAANRLVFDRLEGMMSRLEDASARVIGGDYDSAVHEVSGPRDEVGRFEEFFAGFLRVVADALRELSRGR